MRQYAGWAGIEDCKVSWQTLRNTAVLTRLAKEESLEEIHSLLGNAKMANTRAYVKKMLGNKTYVEWKDGYPQAPRPGAYSRGRIGAKPKHGLYSRYLLQDYFSEEGIDTIRHELREVVRLRLVEDRILPLMEQAADDLDAAQALKETLKLLEIGSTAAIRVARRLLKQHRL